MNIARYTDARAFCDRVLPLLLQREAENNLMIGIALRLADGTGKWGDEPPVLCAVEDAGQVVAAALQTPPYLLQLTRMDAATAACLADYLRAIGHTLPGVLGPVEAVEAFTACWTAGTPLCAQHTQGMGVYQLDRVVPPAHPGGAPEEAAIGDMELLIDWITDFIGATGTDNQSPEEIVRNALEKRQYWVWRDPYPVSMAGFCGPTPHGMRVNYVYTPPEHRGKGYASANVATLSQHLLDSGRQFCYLFTDLANPTSNSIYRKIGYRQVCDFASYRFDEE